MAAVIFANRESASTKRLVSSMSRKKGMDLLLVAGIAGEVPEVDWSSELGSIEQEMSDDTGVRGWVGMICASKSVGKN